MALRQITPAEITAAKLRKMARDLILEAEALEASIKPAKTKRRPVRMPTINELYGGRPCSD